MHPRLRRRSLIAATALWPWAAQALPEARSGEWTDGARNRRLPWLLRLPEGGAGGAGGSGPWPVVIYSHGLGGSREGGARWGQAWAEGGIAVLHLQHPGSDTGTLRQGLAALRKAADLEQFMARVADVQFAIDELGRRSGEAPWSSLRRDAIGVAGHSFGAVTTQAIAGQRSVTGRGVNEPRPRAFIAFSPSSPKDRSSLQQAFGAITRPFLGVTGSEDGDPFGSYRSGEPRAAVYEGLPPGQRALLWLDGADHGTCGGGRPPGLGTRTLAPRSTQAKAREPAHEALAARVSTLWWQAQLAGDEGARAALRTLDGLGPGDRFRMD